MSQIIASTYNNDAALHALGATRIEDHFDEAGKLLQRSVEPLVDLSGYDAAVADLLAAANPTAPVPSTISDRQFAHGLWKQNVITFEEARDFLKVGEMPAALAGLVAQMPAAQRKDAELMITGSTSFERAHPFTAAIAAAFGWTNEVTDEFWTYAAAL